MKNTKFAAAFVIAISLAGCAGTGSSQLRAESETSVAQKIHEGKTSKNEVRQMFGSPMKTTFTEGGLEVWNYEFTKMSGDAVNYIPIVNLLGSSTSGKKKELVVMFDQDNIVKRYSMSESDVSVKTGLFNN
ncbi:outer membrane protein assembly factor BamE [Crenobacter sp. SG2303]|uniref:Outer membrane protein assembly factor BamE n=1 Tax=Crenobacter oryzisoli TaxID=3056844 RepID=A0ABT7XNP2_9NEIS|nr:outer membrane protein assembly factor BamE [Crenobacter sp. SG2303]MDN0075411.1 outer membrane protein assembly factor BamE [Crenobacter sp. SG2303]